MPSIPQSKLSEKPLGPSSIGFLAGVTDIQKNPNGAQPAYMARQLIQCTLPHSDPGAVPIWSRTNGSLTLSVRPYIDHRTRKHLYPYGSIPRLLLFWLTTEAVQKKTRIINLGSSLDGFMRTIGLNPRTGGGKRGDAKRLHDHMVRLFRAVISFDDERETRDKWRDMQVGPEGEYWWDNTRVQQENLWESWVELGEKFYAAVTAAPVPVDLRALRAIKRSPLALDLYSCLTHATFVAGQSGKTRLIPWRGLHAQMGAEYSQERDFRIKLRATLLKVQLAYPALKAESSAEGIAVYPSSPAIAKRAASKATPPAALQPPSPPTAQEPDQQATPALPKTRQRAQISEEALDAARDVMKRCALSDDKLEPIIAKSLAAAVVTWVDLTLLQAAELAIKNRNAYVLEGDLHRFVVGPEKFFSHGWVWDRRLWPLEPEVRKRRLNPY